MKIAIVGYGKMGKTIERLAKEQEITITSVENADVCIEFTHPDAVLANIEKLAAQGKNIVVGTTGWYDKLEDVKAIVAKHQIGFLYSPNFSLGVQIFLRLTEKAAKLFKPFPEYDVGGFEAHHKQKVDSPSGTAKAIAARVPGLTFTSLRCGSIPGTHSILFDSPQDTITLTHQAHGREGFASGALLAAKWLQDKKGFYTFEEYVSSIYP